MKLLMCIPMASHEFRRKTDRKLTKELTQTQRDVNDS